MVISVQRLNDKVKASGGMARFGMDDGYKNGPKDVVFSSVQEFAQEVLELCGLELEWSKTQVFSWDGILPEGCLKGVILAGGGRKVSARLPAVWNISWLPRVCYQ